MRLLLPRRRLPLLAIQAFGAFQDHLVKTAVLAAAEALRRLRLSPEDAAQRFRLPLSVALVRRRALDLPPSEDPTA